MIRHDWNAERLRWEVLRPEEHGAWLEKAFSEVARRRAEEADVAALARLHETGMLGGRTYLGALLFFVPRSLWPEKPRSAGAYNNHYNFSRTYVTNDFPRDWGIPVSVPTEAYWNFGWVGVLVIFAAIGGIFRALADIVRARNGHGYSTVVLALALLYLNGSGDGLTRFAQQTFSLVVIAITARFLHHVVGNIRGQIASRSHWAAIN